MPRALLTRCLLAGALAALVAGVLTASAGAAAPRCQDKEGDTVARTSKTRVFQRAKGTIDDGQQVTWFACQIGTRTAVHLEGFRNDLDGDLRIEQAALPSTKYFAVLLDETTGTSDAIQIWLYDISQPDTRLFRFGRDGLVGNAKLAATRHGGVAFLDEDGSLTAWDGAGTHALATSGATDLAWGLGGDRLFWLAGGAAKTTLLSGHASGG